MAFVAMAVAGLSMGSLYQTAFSEQKDKLIQLVRREARSMEVMADQFANMGLPPDEVLAATMKQVIAIHWSLDFGKTGELMVGRLEGDMIKFLIDGGSNKKGGQKPSVSVNSGLAVPMRRALEGYSGVIMDSDYRGVEVLAAYQPVSRLNLGIVAKIDMAELRQPFIRAGAISSFGAILILLFGTVLFRRISSPLAENLEKAVARLTEAQRIARLGNWERNIQTGQGWWSEETYKIFGMAPEEVSPTLESFLGGIHPEDREMVESAIDRCIAGKEPYSIEYRILLPDGTQRTVYGRGTWRIDASGEPARISGTVQDITQRRRAEADLDHQRILFEAVFRDVPDAMVMADTERTIIMINPAFTRTFGYEAKDILGFNGEMIYESPEEFKRQGRIRFNLSAERQLEPYLVTYRRKNGETFPGETVGTQIRDGDGNTLGYIGVIRDVTSRVEAEEALRQALVKAEEANQAKSVFLATMSHELRTPLNSIIGFSETLMRQLFGPLGNDKYKEYAEDINSSGSHLLAVITDILDISKIEAGELDLTEEDVSWQDLVLSGIKMLREQAEDLDITLSCAFPHDSPLLRADPRHIKQIVINLVSNAIKFTPPGGNISLDVSLDGQQGFLLTVQDSGVGIEESNIPKVLEPFGQVGDIYSRNYEGTGLGLPLAKSLVEIHDGTLTLNSAPGKGTTVTVRFPPERTIMDPIPLAAAKS